MNRIIFRLIKMVVYKDFFIKLIDFNQIDNFLIEIGFFKFKMMIFVKED
jgi:hypothetical protein